MSDQQQDATWHAEEMRLGQRRKEEWLERRGTIVTWFVEPFPVSLWIESVWAGMLMGGLMGLLGGVVLLG